MKTYIKTIWIGFIVLFATNIKAQNLPACFPLPGDSHEIQIYPKRYIVPLSGEELDIIITYHNSSYLNGKTLEVWNMEGEMEVSYRISDLPKKAMTNNYCIVKLPISASDYPQFWNFTSDYHAFTVEQSDYVYPVEVSPKQTDIPLSGGQVSVTVRSSENPYLVMDDMGNFYESTYTEQSGQYLYKIQIPASTVKKTRNLQLVSLYTYHDGLVTVVQDNTVTPPVGDGFTPSNQNYIISARPFTANTDLSATDVNKSVVNLVYYDGLGRPMQEVAAGQSQNRKDIVRPIVYDAFGRETQSYLPYERTGTVGTYSATATAEQRTFYNSYKAADAAYALSKIDFEASPLNRVTGQTAPGDRWKNNPASITYTTNSAPEVKLWKVDAANNPYHNNLKYDAGELYVTITTDEEKKVVNREYKNKLGQVVETRQGNLATSYVYDDKGNLCAVIPPKANQSYLTGVNWHQGSLLSGLPAESVARICSDFIPISGEIYAERDPNWDVAIHWYDANKNWIASGDVNWIGTGTHTGPLKKVYTHLTNAAFIRVLIAKQNNSNITPNEAANAIVEVKNTESELIYKYHYDHRNRVVTKKIPGAEVIEMVYDSRDRLVMSRDGNLKAKGQWKVHTYDTLNRPVSEHIVVSGNERLTFQGYWNTSFNQTRSGADYTHKTVTNGPVLNTGNAISYTYYDNYSWATVGYDITGFAGEVPAYVNPPKGQVTGTKVKVLDGNEFTASATWLASKNYYDHMYRLVQHYTQFYNGTTAPANVTISTNYTFDGLPEKVKQIYYFNGHTTIVQSFEYDHARRLTKEYHSINGTTPVLIIQNTYDNLGRLKTIKKGNNETITTDYNIRGWIERSAASKFAYGLDYNLNGNIATQKWNRTGSTAYTNTYTYSYDANNRLLTGTTNGFGENLSYDVNGNITHLVRTTNGTAGAYTYAYNGNQLTSINSKAYVYDANGNMIKDGLKGLTIEYNLLNLPKNVKNPSLGSLEYVYDAAGNKLAKKLNGAFVNFYCGSVVYTGSKTPEYAMHSQGMVRLNGANWDYQYNVTDHLGNVRSVANASNAVLQSTDYFPFGLAHSASNLAKNKYLYNGKELQTELGYNLYDYGARGYDPTIINWLQIDPLVEKYFSYSPYNYVLNRPMNAIDPNGMDVWEMDSQGRIKWVSQSDDHTLYALDNEGGRTGNFITIKDRAILDDLEATGIESNYKASYVHGNPSELASVFLFASDNSSVEWRFSRYDVGNGNQYAIGTIHENSIAISTEKMGFSRDSEIAFIHSHPSKYTNMTGKYGEHGSMGWRVLSDFEATHMGVPKGSLELAGDSNNVYHSGESNYLTYFPHSGNIYEVRGLKYPALIRNIKNHNNNPKSLFWGTLNGR